MSADLSAYQFLPYVRQGLAASITIPDPLGPGIPATAAFGVTLPVNDQAVSMQLDLHGPGDVLGIDPRQVVRTDPLPGSTSFEPNYFPLVEFDRPDFPWLFTPAAATSAGPDGKLRPWLVLVVVRDQPGVEVAPGPGLPLPVLSIGAPASPAAELPDLAESWLWAHGQVLGGQGANVTSLLTGDPAVSVSRLLAARRLDPDTHYRACVVPAFQAGVLAGLGQPVTAADLAALAPAWASGTGAPASVRIPVYYEFDFATAPAGDFESLARLLTARPVPPTVGSRPMDISRPGSGLPVTGPADPNSVLRLAGALQAPDQDPSAWTDPARSAFQAALAADLDASAAAPADTPTVGPPLYGRWHAGVATVPAGAPPWLSELNLDPRNRVVAGLGTRVVQADQEDLMASAWDQIGEVDAANAALRRAQLARAVGTQLQNRHLSALNPADLLQLTAAVHPRVRTADPAGSPTLSATVAGSALPRSAASAPMRRALRARGPLARRAFGTTQNAIVTRMAAGTLAAAPPWPDPDGTLTVSDPVGALGPELSAQVFAQVNVASMLGTGTAANLGQLVATISQRSGSAPLVTQAAVQAAPPASAFQLATAATAISAVRVLGTATAVSGLTVLAATANPFTTAVTVTAPPGITVRPVGGGTGLKLASLAGAPQMLAAAAVAPASGAARAAALPLPVIGTIAGGAAGGVSTVGTAAGGSAAGSAGTADSAVAAEFRAATSAGLQLMVVAGDVPADPAPPALDLGAARARLLAVTDAEQAITGRVLSLVTLPAARPAHVDPIDPVMAAPSFPRPMWQALRDLSQDWLLPGLEDVLPNTVTLVVTNPTFVAAFMVGLSFEMGRELLWREYPSDNRGTYFRQFWGLAGPEASDIDPITSWTGGGDLASFTHSGDQSRLVLLIRGELLRRYPGAAIYAVRAGGTPDTPVLDDTQYQLPLFRGQLLPDITFVGFDLTQPQVEGDTTDPGWWFVIAQQPTEPRFGMEPASFPAPALTSWNDLSWAHVAADPPSLQALAYAPAKPAFPPPAAAPLAGPGPEGLTWGTGSGVQAHLVFRQPVRVAIHATDMLNPPKDG
jgi:hypothetical protein